MVPTAASMSSMQKMQERAKQQQNIRQDTQQMRPMFGPEEEGGHGEKPEQCQTASRTEPVSGTRVRLPIHHFPFSRHRSFFYCVFFVARFIRSDICFIMPDTSLIIFDIFSISSGVILPLPIICPMSPIIPDI